MPNEQYRKSNYDCLEKINVFPNRFSRRGVLGCPFLLTYFLFEQLRKNPEDRFLTLYNPHTRSFHYYLQARKVIIEINMSSHHEVATMDVQDRNKTSFEAEEWVKIA